MCKVFHKFLIWMFIDAFHVYDMNTAVDGCVLLVKCARCCKVVCTLAD